MSLSSFFAIFLVGFGLVAVEGGIEIPTNGCQWRGEKYGHMIQCEGNELAIGSCGSGKNDDCSSGQWHQILCCDMPDYLYQDCLEYRGEHGQEISCVEKDLLLEGHCGSGTYSDCDGVTHIVSDWR